MYEADPEKLSIELEKLLSEATISYTQSEDKTLKAIIVPHGKLSLSGATAASAYVNIQPLRYNRVVVLGP